MTSIVYNAEPLDYSPQAISKWRESGYEYIDGDWQTIESFERKDEVCVLIVRLKRKVDRNILNLFPNLQALISATTGITHLDIESLNQRNIQLICLRGHDDFLRTIPSTAELCWGLLLSMLRSIPEAIGHVEMGDWNRENFKGFQLAGKSIGIVGLGRIGSMMARYAKAFNMRIRYYDPLVESNEFDRCGSIEELFQNSEIVSIHIHADAENRNLINDRLIGLMPKGGYLLNTSRGEVWNEKAVWEAICSGQIKKAATDVLQGEPIQLEKSLLWQNRLHPSLYITPHIGGASYDAMWACETFTQNLFLSQN